MMRCSLSVFPAFPPLIAASLLVAGCTEMPTGPAVAVMPGPYKPFEVFIQDDQLCRGWAAHSIGAPGHDAAADAFLRSMATGAAVGAIAGAASGGNRGAAHGAGAGTVIGATAGASQSASAGWAAQRRYDIAYEQCMYAKGNLVPEGGYRYQQPVPAPPAPAPR